MIVQTDRSFPYIHMDGMLSMITRQSEHLRLLPTLCSLSEHSDKSLLNVSVNYLIETISYYSDLLCELNADFISG